MRKTLCNRCGNAFSGNLNSDGQLEMKYGSVEIEADLCGDCYAEMVDAYTQNA